MLIPFPLPYTGGRGMRVKHIDLDTLLDVKPAIRGYMAGFFDGEGHISIARRGWLKTTRDNSTPMRRVYGLVAGAAQNKKAPLELFYDLFGGTLRIDNRHHQKHGQQTIWEWNIGGNTQVPLFLQFLMPYLLVKKAQAQIAIEFAHSVTEVDEELFEQFCSRMREARMADTELRRVA